MGTATALLLAIGLLGALDVFAYHTALQRIRTLPSARTELVAHALRGPTYALLFVAIPNFALHGAWCVALIALLAIDAGISVFDFAVERESRAPVGGLPTGEYILHSVIAGLFGAFCFAVAGVAGEWLSQPTAIVAAPAAPAPLRALLGVMAVGVAVSGLQDAVAVVRLGRLERDAVPASASVVR